MRSTTFVGFGAVLIILLLWIIYSNLATSNGPVMRTTNAFLSAIRQQDAVAVQRMVDPNTVTVTAVGNKITSIDFAQMHGKGGLASYPANVWDYAEIKTLALNPDIAPDVADEQGLATISLTHGVYMYLQRIAKTDNWKVIYISGEASRNPSRH